MTAPKAVNKQIASVGHIEELPNGRDTYMIDRPGMTWDEIQEHFPPKGRPGPHGYNRRGLIRAIIYEAYVEAQSGYDRDRMNVRGFWYDRLLGTIRRVAGDEGDQATIDGTINDAWGDLIDGGHVTYAGMNIYSTKSGNYYTAVKEHSPYPTSILLVEKEDHFDPLHRLADTYEISFVATGGQNSRCAAMEFAEQLKKTGIDTTQPFTVYSFCDFDPEGWAIPESFIEHMQLKIDAPINLVRLGVLPDQISEDVLRYQGSPYSPETKTESGAKAVATKYQRFVDETGGCFMPDTGKPARIELNMYKTDQIRDKILDGLSQYIDGFEYQKAQLETAVNREYSEAWRTLSDAFAESVNEVFDPYFEAIDGAMESLRAERAQRAPEARRRKRELLRQIAELDSAIEAATVDIAAQEGALANLSSTLYDEAYHEDIHDYLSADDCPAADDLIGEIEANGGWRRWVDSLQIRALDGAALAEAARQKGSAFEWQPDPDERHRIQDWITQHFPTVPDPVGPDVSPEKLIEESLGRV